MGVTWSQLFPPPAEFTESDLPNLNGKVFMVTGATSGIGYQLASILYHAGGTVWVVGRSEADGAHSIEEIKATSSEGEVRGGALHFLPIDLQDLTTIRKGVNNFKTQESRLDVLFNNAGVSLPPAGSKSAQGFELMMATNCLGPYLLTELLYPLLQETAARSLPGAVRVVWTTSQYVELSGSRDGMDLALLDSPSSDQTVNYVNTKLGNWYLANEYARVTGSTDERSVLSVVQNPGNVKTNLLRHMPRLMQICVQPLLHPAKQGAYTELWAGLSPEVTMERSGAYIIPWGRFHPGLREGLVKGLGTEEEGGTGQAVAFRDWCENKTVDYR
ncbi:MAG: hypothetical protein M1831_004696 [Alyxoria varia]|nr:MAG: hypothetical protein M1831_004696 [Alyxoria varia]